MLNGTVLLTLALLLSSCATPPTPDLVAERDLLLTILASDRMAHLETNADALVENIADTLLSVDNGVITVQPRGQIRQMFTSYFEGATYDVWEDIEPPHLRLSDDATMAWVIRRIRVDRREPGPDGTERRRLFVSAYTATYAKVAGGWKMTTVTSTFVPQEAPSRGV